MIHPSPLVGLLVAWLVGWLVGWQHSAKTTEGFEGKLVGGQRMGCGRGQNKDL